MRTSCLGLLAVFLTGCPDRSIDNILPTQNGVMVKKIPISADIDILFVIDNSQSTLDKQTVFSQNFPRFVQALDAFPMGRPNLHIGVVDTTVDIATQGYAIGNLGVRLRIRATTGCCRTPRGSQAVPRRTVSS